ncbi:hypothetical protein pb186bvf_015881 [Paramecium bursaria]
MIICQISFNKKVKQILFLYLLSFLLIIVPLLRFEQFNKNEEVFWLLHKILQMIMFYNIKYIYKINLQLSSNWRTIYRSEEF